MHPCAYCWLRRCCLLAAARLLHSCQPQLGSWLQGLAGAGALLDQHTATSHVVLSEKQQLDETGAQELNA